MPMTPEKERELAKLRELLARVESASEPLIELDREIGGILEAALVNIVEPPRYTSSIDAAVALAERVLPGWAWKIGTCCVSDDAWVCPDYNSPEHGERLRREFPLPSERYEIENVRGAKELTWGPFDTGFDIDRRPPGNVALALCQAILEAKLYIAELETPE
jgi:hypothetical protein